jgi:site-specific recombinase XerD
MFNLGLRAGADLAWLAKKDIEAALKSGTSLVIVTKGSKERELPAAVVMDEMKCLIDIDEDWEILADLIVSIKSKEDKFSRVKNAYERIRRVVKALAEAADINPDEVHTHRLRHNFAQRVYAETGDILMVQKVLGHSNQNTTQGYLKKNTTIDVGERLMAAKKAREEGED